MPPNIRSYRQTYIASYTRWSRYNTIQPANIQLRLLDLDSRLRFLTMLTKCKQSILVSSRKSPVREPSIYYYAHFQRIHFNNILLSLSGFFFPAF